MLRARNVSFASLLPIVGVLAAVAHGGDWPTWRHDARRSGASREELAAALHVRWVRQCPPLVPAWPDEPRMRFDVGYEPVVMGKTLFFGSPRNDSVTALDTETGRERWRFYAEGPVRLAPVAWRGKLYFACDDGCVYCLDAATGAQVWRFRGAPSARKVLGNGRLISVWPARGAPVVADGRLYFAAGIWPFEGIFIYALDAATGKVAWVNDGTGAMYIRQPHNSPAFAGVAPQGYLVAAGDRLLVPGGRSVPACLERATGRFLYYHLAATLGSGGYHVSASRQRFFFNAGGMFALADGSSVMRMAPDPVVDDSVVYASRPGHLAAYGLSRTTAARVSDSTGRAVQQWTVPKLWERRARGKVHIKAGERLFAGGRNVVRAINTARQGGGPRLSWEAQIEGTPSTMLAADGKLFVVTLEGRIYCFGPGPAPAAPAAVQHAKLDGPGRRDEWTRTAGDILKHTGVSEGYCLVLGVGTGRLAEELARQSKLHIIGVDPDPQRVQAARRRLDGLGLYGTRVAIHTGEPLAFGLPPCLASLIVSEDLQAAGLDQGTAFAEGIFRSLRPYGGVACLAIPRARRKAFARRVSAAGLAKAELTLRGRFALLRRVGALPGSADWTHQYADAANTCVSKDGRVRAPLGLLWFGGSSNAAILPRHGHGPSQHVVGGRLIIEGPNGLRATDVYTGRVLWDAKLPGIGKAYDQTTHQPGANAIGSNYVSAHDGIYVAYSASCLRLDPATGKGLDEFKLRVDPGADAGPAWGYLGVWQDLLVATISPETFRADVDFTRGEFRNNAHIRQLAEWLATLRGFELAQNRKGQELGQVVVRDLNRLLGEHALLAKLPPNRAARRRVAQLQADIEAHLARRPATAGNSAELRRLNRGLLARYNPLIPSKLVRVGAPNVWSGTASKCLIAVERYTGNMLWRRWATHSFGHNGLAVGGGKVFCIDKLPQGELSAMKRRGRTAEGGAQLLALDARSGKVLWATQRHVFGTWLGYSADHDVLLQATRPSRDMLPEPGRRMIAFRGSDGTVLWDRPHHYGGPCMLHGDTIITQGCAFSLLTGAEKTRAHPLTGVQIPWRFTRNYGCNTAIASTHLITFRSAAAGYYDLAADAGTANLGGFRSGCTPNLIAANGVLTAPDYTRTCTCSYQNQTSLAFVHVPEAETWTFNALKLGDHPIKRVGINFGAPGDRRAPNGTLWLDYPSVGGPSPDVTVRVEPASARAFRRHASRLHGPGLTWVGASGLEGATSISLTLAARAATPRPYTVRLTFAEPRDVGPGRRVFAVALQGQDVLRDFDIVRAAGGPRRVVVREFRGVRVSDMLTVTLKRSPDASGAPPLLCGLEALAEGW